MKSDEELRREFRERHEFILGRVKRLIFILPVLLVGSFYLSDRINHLPPILRIAAIFAFMGVAFWFTNTKGRLRCPKCSSPQTIRGLRFNINDMRTCVGCGFVLVPEAPEIKKNPNPFYENKVGRGITLAIITLGAGIIYLGYKDYLALGVKTGIAVIVFGVLAHFGLFRSPRICPKCNSLNENFGSFCNHCGEEI